MHYCVDVWCFLIVAGGPFRYETHGEVARGARATDLCGFQPLVLICVFFQLTAVWGVLQVASRLEKPFDLKHIDTFNVDALIAGTEFTLFYSLRAAFNKPTEASDEDELPGDRQ